jgi:hypothetical protein
MNSYRLEDWELGRYWCVIDGWPTIRAEQRFGLCREARCSIDLS